MIESSPAKLKMTQEWSAAGKFGVVLFVIDPEGRVLTLREREENLDTGKKVGDYSVICETRQLGEAWLENTNRALEEELGISRNKLRVINLEDKIVWETGFKDGVWATVVVAKCNNPDLLLDLVGKDRELDGVEVVGWKSPDEFRSLNPIREGVSNIIQKFDADIFQK